MRPFDPRLLRLVPAARMPLAGLALLGVLQGAAAIVQAFAISAVVVAVAQSQDVARPLTMAALAFAARGLLAGAAEWLAAYAGAGVSGALRAAWTTSILRRTADDRPEAAGSLTLATSGAGSVEPYVARFLPALVSSVVLPVAATVTMAVLDWRTAIIPVLTVPLLPLFAALIGAATAEATNRRWRTLAQLSGHFLDVMRGLPTLAGYGRADRQTAVIRSVSDEHRLATVATLRLAFVSSGALELLATISVALVAVSVGIRLADGSMALSLAMPLILLAPEAYWPIRRVGAEFHAAADGVSALRAILDELDRPEPTTAHARAGAPSPAAPAVTADPATRNAPTTSLHGVTYRYPGSSTAVIDGLTATFQRGLTVVSGPSGAGKTTLLELVAGLRAPTSGHVDAASAHLVTQRPFLAAASIRDNLRLGAPAGVTDADLSAALERVGLRPLIASLPLGLDTPLGDDGFGLSAGQRARLATARALVSEARIVLLDEPTAHLDEESERLIHDVIRDLARTTTVVAVTHRPGLAAMADHHLALGATA